MLVSMIAFLILEIILASTLIVVLIYYALDARLATTVSVVFQN